MRFPRASAGNRAGAAWPTPVRRRIRNGGRKQAGILVVDIAEIDALIRSKGDKPQPLPVEEVLRSCRGDARTMGRKCRVGHYITVQRFDERNTRILAATAAVSPLLVVSLWLQRNARRSTPEGSPALLNCTRQCRCASNCPALPAEENIKVTVRAASGSGIQNALHFLRLPGSGSINIPRRCN